MPAPRQLDRSPGPALCAAALAGVVGVCILVPAGYAVASSLRTSAPHGTPPGPGAVSLLTTLGRTAIAAGAIALLSTLLAVPGAWVIREASAAGARRAAACVGVLMLPNYLAYAGLNLLRAPRSPLADWLADQPPWASVLAGHVIAVLGLSLWAWPVAALVLGLALRRVGQDQLDALALSGACPCTRARMLARMMLPGLAAAPAIVFILMLGSPVPFHVAQLDTYGVALWRRLNQTGDPASAWISAWPLVLLAGAASVVVARGLSRRLAADVDPTPASTDASPSRVARLGLWLVLALSLALPLGLHALATAAPGSTFSFTTFAHVAALFWRESSGALAASARTALLCAGVFVLITIATWACLSCTPRRRRSPVRTIVLASIALLLTAALTPGAILGSATAAAWSTLPVLRTLADTTLPVVCVHTARFGALAALLGAWAALLEPPALRDIRELSAPGSLGAFFRACVRANWAVLAASGIAGFVLSLHEIESTVFVQPPGSGNLAQQLLDALHFSRDDRLGIAAIILALASLALSYIAAWLITRPRPGPPAPPAPRALP